ncbi:MULTISPECIES: DUF3592 domain-containing protein [Niastella]|uniref:DUF3592 domain-containing protein n=1 Tax=Niastella soli TaxID=2821487 RepID=A0ABS3YT53_9BACT|nr:hypothetical protein [Niastella soli]MBO9201048.1 hypothetical protein [Niastella soli]
MVISRTKFFVAIILLLVTPLVVSKIIWLLQAKKTTGIFAFESYGPALDQIRFPYSMIYFMVGKDTFWFKGPGKLELPENTLVPIRYLPRNPSNAKLDSFRSIWIGTIIYGGIPLLILLVIFLHPAIVPYRSKVHLTLDKPFLRVV